MSVGLNPQRLHAAFGQALENVKSPQRLAALKGAEKPQDEGAALQAGAQSAFASAQRFMGGFTPPSSDVSQSQRVSGIDKTQQPTGVSFQPKTQALDPNQAVAGANLSKPTAPEGFYGPANLSGGDAYARRNVQPAGGLFQQFG